MWFSLAAAQGEQRAVKTLEMAVRRMTPAQMNEAQKLPHGYATNSSLKACALRPVSQLATGRRSAVSFPWKRYGTVGHIGS
jgi:hypothetical protein